VSLARSLAPVAASIAIGAACVAIVVSKAASAPTPAAARPIRPDERAHYAMNVSVNEDEWQRLSAENFPGDNWSERDDFHSREASRIRELAKERGASYEDLLRAIDEDLHKGAGTKANERRNVRAVPCTPRPFYD
jgi:hypothetical protein